MPKKLTKSTQHRIASVLTDRYVAGLGECDRDELLEIITNERFAHLITFDDETLRSLLKEEKEIRDGY